MNAGDWDRLPSDSYGPWRDAFRRLMAEADVVEAVRETSDDDTPEDTSAITEDFVQRVWAEGHVRPGAMITERGKRVAIVSPGKWNHAAGPDFLGAELTLEGRSVRGDVEIHLRASGWHAHRHFADPAYNNVVLHVFLDNDDGAKMDHLASGEKIDRIMLRPFLFPDLETLRASLQTDEPEHEAEPVPEPAATTCQAHVRAMGEASLTRLLELASAERLRDKAKRLARVAPRDLGQAAYQNLLLNIGPGPLRPLLFLLGRRAPLGDMQKMLGDVPKDERPETLQCWWFHLAGLMPDDTQRGGFPDDATRDYVGRLDARWRRWMPYWEDRLMPPTRAWWSRVRPINFPIRLLAGLSFLVSEWMMAPGGFAAALRELLPASAPPMGEHATAPKKMIRDIARRFEVDQPDHVWARRYSWNGEPTASPMMLIGEQRARLLAFNLLPPWLLALSETRDAALPTAHVKGWSGALWRGWPTLIDNDVTRAMTARLWGDDSRAKLFLTGESRAQALIQLHRDCCAHSDASGGSCPGLKGV